MDPQEIDELLRTALDEYSLDGIHPAANIFPMLDPQSFAELVQSVEENGFATNAVAIRKEGKALLLDGRNRLAASVAARKDVHVEFMEIPDPVSYVLDLNLHRRQLNPGQRAVVALKVRELLQPLAKERMAEAGRSSAPGRPAVKASADLREVTTTDPIIEVAPQQAAASVLAESRVSGQAESRKSTAQAAKAVGASPRSVEQAARVAKSAPDLLPKVQDGSMALDRAHKEAQQRERQKAATIPQPEVPKVDPGNWIRIPDHKGGLHEYPKPQGKATFNAQKGTEIGWAMYSWNPVTGCLHGCTYCYARAIATSRDMAKYYPTGFDPLFHPERIEAPANTPVPQKAAEFPEWGRVFVCSMSDLFGSWVPQDWIDQVVQATAENTQWEYLFLTKYPQRYHKLNLPSSGWIGASIDSQNRVKSTLDALDKIEGVKVKWLSLEPLLEPLHFDSLTGIDWIVIGAQSANEPQNSEFAPHFEWVADIVATAKRDGCKVWLKTNLLGQASPQFPGMKLLQEIPESRGGSDHENP